MITGAARASTRFFLPSRVEKGDQRESIPFSRRGAHSHPQRATSIRLTPLTTRALPRSARAHEGERSARAAAAAAAVPDTQGRAKRAPRAAAAAAAAVAPRRSTHMPPTPRPKVVPTSWRERRWSRSTSTVLKTACATLRQRVTHRSDALWRRCASTSWSSMMVSTKTACRDTGESAHAAQSWFTPPAARRNRGTGERTQSTIVPHAGGPADSRCRGESTQEIQSFDARRNRGAAHREDRGARRSTAEPAAGKARDNEPSPITEHDSPS